MKVQHDEPGQETSAELAVIVVSRKIGEHASHKIHVILQHGPNIGIE